LAGHYALNDDPVAFLDESFETEDKDSFYVIAVAVVDSGQVVSSRLALREFYGGSALHAAPMFDKREIATLRQATELVGRQNDGMDIVICAPIRAGASRDEARARCLSYAVAKVHRDFGTKLFVLDSLGTPTENTLDQYTFGDLKRGQSKALSRDAVAVHCRPSEELLLGLPDVAAWAYRQEHTGRDRTWFEPLREFTKVTVL
jgi:alkanesulfonate monooxygenase SsuD/methylene tetrahydromethanopterin reductase-like flavin-dependent oxidoreductase (luciferase family)